MFEKVNPSHPDKVADRIAGAIVDLAYSKDKNRPRVACEVMIGHGQCHIINETTVHLEKKEVKAIVERIAGKGQTVDYLEVPQDPILSMNQADEIRCGDNGIFRGVLPSEEERTLAFLVDYLYYDCGYNTDGKFILDNHKLIVCQSCSEEICKDEDKYNEWKNKLADDIRDGEARCGEWDLDYAIHEIIINPLGPWTGGLDTDTGCTNRKLGSDMGRSATGGGLHGKDISKADVAVNIIAQKWAMAFRTTYELSCAIGDTEIDTKENALIPYSEIVEEAMDEINYCGGFEKFAEWGMLRFYR